MRRPIPLVATRMAMLAVAGALEGLLVANGPLLEKYVALRLGSRGLLIDLDLLFALVLAAAAVAAALAPWTHALFLGLGGAAASWSLSESSVHPFWLLSKKTRWVPHDPSGAVLAAHLFVLALVCAASLVQGLQAYRKAAFTQRIEPDRLRDDTRRLIVSGVLLLAATLAVAVPLLLLLDDLAGQATGAITGRTAFAVLVGSALLLLVGVALLAAPGKAPRRKAKPAADERPS